MPPKAPQNLRKCLSDNQVVEKQKQAFNTRSNNHLLSIYTQIFQTDHLLDIVHYVL